MEDRHRVAEHRYISVASVPTAKSTATRWMRKMTNKTSKVSPAVAEMLRESNAIEGIYDDASLVQAIVAWQYLIKHKRITVGNILRTHKMLMLNQPLQPDQKGYFRRVEVTVGGQYGMHWEWVPQAVEAWVEDVSIKALDFETIKQLHVRFEKIHPFVDGNGRIGRMLLNWQVVRHLGKTPVVIKESERTEYYQWFK